MEPQPAGNGGSPMALLESAIATLPGPEVMVALAVLVPSELDEGARVLLLQAWERQARWVAAQQSAALAAVAGPPTCGSDDEDWAREGIAPALGLAPGTALCQL